MKTNTNYIDLFKTMDNDVSISASKINANPEEFDYYSRAYIRAVASWVEGSISMYKAIAVHHPKRHNLPLESQLYLHDFDWAIQNGKIKSSTKKVRTKDNLKCFFSTMSELHSDYLVDFDSSGWSSLMGFYEHRDSMMHPKCIDDLILNKDVILRVQAGVVWFRDQISKLNECISTKKG